MMRLPTPLRPPTAVLIAAAILLAACSARATAPTIADPWVRSNPNGLGAAYLRITMPVDDRLVAAEVDPSVAARVEVHEVIDDAGRMLMREVDGGIPLPADLEVELRPGSYHLMLLDMPAMLEVGTKVTITLRFATSDPVSVEAEVREGSDRAMPGMHGADHGSLHLDSTHQGTTQHGGSI